jgi:hypothetical protein
LVNLPNFHKRIVLMFPHLRPPEFECTDVKAVSLRLHYHSHRRGLAPFVTGLLEGLGEMFRPPVTVKHEQSLDAGAPSSGCRRCSFGSGLAVPECGRCDQSSH